MNHAVNARFERVVSALGNLARPSVLYLAAWSSAVATVSIVWMRLDLIAGAAFITAAWGGVALLYGAKAIEERGKNKDAAEVEVARAGGDRRRPLPVKIENEPDEPVPVEETRT